MVGMDSKFKGARVLANGFRESLFVIFGTLILAVGSAVFLIPFEHVAGGISGFAIAASELFGGSLVSVEAIIAALSWTLFLAGLLSLGKSFALKTLISTALYPLFIALIIESGISDFALRLLPNAQGAFLASLIGGALVGLGLGLSFLGGGSTGGADILAFILCKKFPRLKMPHVILAIDSAVILFGALAIADAKRTLLGILSAATAAATVKAVFTVKNVQNSDEKKSDL